MREIPIIEIDRFDKVRLDFFASFDDLPRIIECEKDTFIAAVGGAVITASVHQSALDEKLIAQTQAPDRYRHTEGIKETPGWR